MRRHSQEAGQSPRKRRFQDAEFEQVEEEVVSQSHSDEVDTPGDVVPPSGEQSHDGETTQPPKKHTSKLSLTLQIPKRSPTKKKKQGSARHLEQSGIPVDTPVRRHSQEAGQSPQKTRFQDAEFEQGEEEVVSQNHSDEVDTPGDVVPPSGEQSHDRETTQPPKKHSSKLSLTSQIPKRSPTKKKKQGSARHLEKSGIPVDTPVRRHSQEAGQSPRKRRFQDAEFEQGEEEVVSRSHSDEVDTPGDLLAPSEEGEQSRGGETTQPPKKHSSKLSLLASQVDRRKRFTSQIHKWSPTKKRKQGSARHLEQSGIPVDTPVRQHSQEAGQSPRKTRFQDAEFEQGEEEVVSQNHSDEVDTPGDVVPPSGEQSHDRETTQPPKKHSSKLSLTSQIPKRSPTKKKKQGSARHLEKSGIPVDTPVRRHSQEAGQSPRKRRFQDAEFEQGEEEVVSRSHSDEVDTPGDLLAPSEEGEQSRGGETTQPPKKHSSKLSLLASQVDRRKRFTSQIHEWSPTKKRKQGSARHLEQNGIRVDTPVQRHSQEAGQSPRKGRRLKGAKYGDLKARENKSKTTQTQGKGTLNDEVKNAGLLHSSSHDQYPRASRLVNTKHNVEKSGKVKEKSERAIPTNNEQTYVKGLHGETEGQRKSVQALLSIKTTDSALHRIAFTRG